MINGTQHLDAMHLAAMPHLHSHLQQNRPKHINSLVCHHLFNYPIGRLMNCWNKENQLQYSGWQYYTHLPAWKNNSDRSHFIITIITKLSYSFD